MMSGGPIDKFREGWAVRIFSWGKAHYFRRDDLDLAKPICGAPPAVPALLRGLGSWKKCARCEAAITRRAKPMSANTYPGLVKP